MIVVQGNPTGEDAPGSVMIGFGDPNPGGTAHAVVLSQKGYRGERLYSVSQFLTSVPDSMWAMWSQRVADLEDVKTLFVDDYSLDTCFAWLLFVARLEERPVSAATDFDVGAWVKYVTAWEGGNFVDVAVESSPACLLTALGHALLPAPGADAKPGLDSCLQFLQEMLDVCPAPPVGGLPSSFSSGLYRQALAQIDFDRQQYEAALTRGKTFQLLLPSSVEGGHEQRLLIVDALALNETEPTGILKVMARTDRTHTWTRRGFAVLALNRPSQAGTGNEMTISVDPAPQLTLKALWRRLEELEDERWAGERPRDDPRPIVSYLNDGRMKAGAPNQPWWDDNGRYTLIGAPKEGLTRLEWRDDVLPATWDLYFLQHTRRRVTFESQRYEGKNVHLALWQSPSPGTEGVADVEQQLPDTPSFRAWLAACSTKTHAHEVRSPIDLSDEDAFERIPHDGGYAVITRQGVTLFHETAPSAGDDLLSVAKRMAEAIKKYSDFLKRYSSDFLNLSNELWSEDGRGKPNAQKSFGEWQDELSAARGRLLDADAKLAALPPGFDADRLRVGLAKMWGLHDRRDEVRVLLDRIEEFMRERAAKRTERRERIYGSVVSAVALAIAFGEVSKPIGDALSLTPHQSHLFTPLAYLTGFLIGLGAFWLFGVEGQTQL